MRSPKAHLVGMCLYLVIAAAWVFLAVRSTDSFGLWLNAVLAIGSTGLAIFHGKRWRDTSQGVHPGD